MAALARCDAHCSYERQNLISSRTQFIDQMTKVYKLFDDKCLHFSIYLPNAGFIFIIGSHSSHPSRILRRSLPIHLFYAFMSRQRTSPTIASCHHLARRVSPWTSEFSFHWVWSFCTSQELWNVLFFLQRLECWWISSNKLFAQWIFHVRVCSMPNRFALMDVLVRY